MGALLISETSRYEFLVNYIGIIFYNQLTDIDTGNLESEFVAGTYVPTFLSSSIDTKALIDTNNMLIIMQMFK